MEHFIYIKCRTKFKNRILMKLYKSHINVYDIYTDHNDLYLKIKKEDQERIKKEIVTTKFIFVKDTGLFQIQKLMPPLKVFMIVSFLFLTNFFSRFIVQVDVIHSNKEIRNLVAKSLEEEKIHVWTLKKDYNTLQSIKEKIINRYKDQLEWIEIENEGMRYVVRIEERILNPEKQEKPYCHIVASKSGVIDRIMSTKGEVLVHEGQYVVENERLITGEITFNENIVNQVCAEGSIYAEVFYKTSVSMPIQYTTKEKTGKKRWNLSIENETGKYKIFRSRLSTYETESRVLFHFFNFTIYFDTEYETKETQKEYDLETGTNKALELADEKIKAKFLENESIKTRKVLKNTLNDSTIDVDIFYSVIENIAKVEEYSISIEKEGNE